MSQFNKKNPTINWSEEEKYDFCKYENKWIKDIHLINRPEGVKNGVRNGSVKAGDDTLIPTFSTMKELITFTEKAKASDELKYKHRCHLCDYGTNGICVLKLHLTTHQVREKLPCSHCNKLYISEASLNDHIKRIHKRDKAVRFQCSQCDVTFATNRTLKNHVQVVHGEKTMKCDQCDKSYATLMTLKVHQKSAHLQKRFKCTQCEVKSFKSELQLAKHGITEHNHDSFPCNLCEKIFPTRNSLQSHIHRLHDSTEKWSCKVCSFSTIHKQDFIRHMRIHTGEKGFQCKICSMEFSTKTHLNRHSKTHVSPSKRKTPFACDSCESSFDEKNQLVRHKQRVHEKKKNWFCPKCHYSSYSRLCMEKHQQRKHSS